MLFDIIEQHLGRTISRRCGRVKRPGPTRLVSGVPEVRVVGDVEAVLAQPGRPDVVGIGGHAEDAASQDQPDHHAREPGRGRHERQQYDRDDHADRHDDGEVPQDRPEPPSRVGELVLDPVPVVFGKAESQRETQPAQRARVAGNPRHRPILADAVPAGECLAAAGSAQPAQPVMRRMLAAAQSALSAQPVIRQIAWPAETVWPTLTLISATVPSLCAVSGCSIFMASRTTTVSPAVTRWPSLATILTMVPCMGLASTSLPAA